MMMPGPGEMFCDQNMDFRRTSVIDFIFISVQSRPYNAEKSVKSLLKDI